MALQTPNVGSGLAILKLKIGRTSVPRENLTAREIDMLQTAAIDLITVHDVTVTVITELGTIEGNKMIDDLGLGEIATGIATADTRTMESVLRIPTGGDILLLNIPAFLPMVHPVLEGHLTPIGKKASEYHPCLSIGHLVFDTHIPGYPLILRASWD
jgi:hypothetical protein